MARLLSVLSGLFGALNSLLAIWRERKLIQQGRQEAAVDAIKEVEARVDKAKAAAAAVDPDRSERLRKRFDRSAAGGE